MQQHCFSNTISQRKKPDFKKNQQKRAIIQKLARSYSLKNCDKLSKNECTTLTHYNSSSQPNLLAIASTPHSQNNESETTSKLSMRDEWKRLNSSFSPKMPFISKLNQTFLPKVPSSVQFRSSSIMNSNNTISMGCPLLSVNKLGSTSSAANANNVNGTGYSLRQLTEPLVEEPASDGEEEEEFQIKKRIYESDDSEPEEEDGIIVEKAIPIAKGCDRSNISSRVFLDRQYLNSQINQKVTLHISEISELFSYEDEEDVVEDDNISNKSNENEKIINDRSGKYSKKVNKSNKNVTSKSPKKQKVSSSTSKAVNGHLSPSKLEPLTIITEPNLSFPSTSQSPTSPLSTNSVKTSPLSSPSAVSRKKVSLTGTKNVLESYSNETEQPTSKMSGEKQNSQKSEYHPSSFLDRLTSEMIDNGTLLSEDEEDKKRELTKIKTESRCKKKKSPMIGASKNLTINSSSVEDYKERNTIIHSPENALSERRRSVRNRVRPLNYWTGQRPLYHVTVDNKGSPIKTLIGVKDGNSEPAKMKSLEKKKQLTTNKNQKMVSIFNLSIDHPRFVKKFTNAELHDNEHVLAFNQVKFRESAKSPGVFTALTKKASNIAFGKLKFTPKSVKKRTKTGSYISHFNVVYGTLLLKLNNEKVGSIIQTGFYFHVGKQTNYTLTNLRNDEAMIDFTIIKDS